MNRDLEGLEAEVVSVGRIYTEELQQDPDIFRKKVDAKINEILNKYGFVYSIADFSWANGQVSANIILVEKPKAIEG